MTEESGDLERRRAAMHRIIDEATTTGQVSVSRLTALLRRNAKMLKAQDKKLAEQQETIDRQAVVLGEIRRIEYTAASDLLFRRDVRDILRRLDGGAE